MKTVVQVTIEHENDAWHLMREIQHKVNEIPEVTDCQLQLMIAGD